MIERIIENWLTRSSEKTYQLPFCYLLMKEGHKIIHLTRHCGMEHGKDILSIDPDGNLCAFQLKGSKNSKLSLKEWQESIVGQINQLIHTPVTHPSAPNSQYHKSFLVTNGDIVEEVTHAIHAQNQEWIKKGCPQFQIHTIVKGELIEKALRLKPEFIPSEINDFKALLEFYLEDGKNLLDKEKFCAFIESFIESSIKTKSEAKRCLSSLALLCTLTTSPYTENENQIPIIEAWSIYLFYVFWIIEKYDLAEIDYKAEVSIAEDIIHNSLQNLLEEAKELEDFLISDSLADVFVVHSRTTLILSFISCLYIYESLKGHNNSENENTIFNILEKHKQHIEPWGESFVPHALNISWSYLLNKKKAESNEIRKTILNTLLDYQLNANKLFPNIYYSPDEAISLKFESDTRKLDRAKTNRSSYSIEAVLHLCVSEENKDFLKLIWTNITRIYFLEFQYNNISDYYRWRVREGKEVTITPVLLKKWSDLKKEILENEGLTLPPMLKLYPHLTPLLLAVYPHRLNSSIARWFDNYLQALVKP